MSFPTHRTYPPARYHGNLGQRTAWVHPADAEPELTYTNGGLVSYLATGANTEGQFGMYKWVFGDGESGPEPHFHRAISESFYVLEGTVRLYDGNEWVDGRPGDFLHVPEGAIHGFRNVSGAPASMLLMFHPGAPREDYFETLARLAERGPMSDEERADFFARHDTYWV